MMPSFGEIVLLLILGAVVYLVATNKGTVKAAVLDLLDDGKLNGSAAQPAVAQAPAPAVTPEHLQAVADIVRAAQPAVTAPVVAQPPAYNGVGDPPSQEAWAAWRASQPATLQQFIPAIWKPTPTSSNGDQALMDAPLQFAGGTTTERLVPHVRRRAVGRIGEWLTILIPGGVHQVVLQPAPTSTPGADQVRYNLVAVSSGGGVVAGDEGFEFQYNAAVLAVDNSATAVKVRALVVDGVDFYIQAN